jgi:RNA-directed DNA polymerase
MRLPQPLLESPFFLFERMDDLLRALGSELDHSEVLEIRRLTDRGLPPVTSEMTIAVMLGMNPGFVWSLLNKTSRYYRRFSIPKGRGVREIHAPKVALKIVQKWISVHLNRLYQAPEHVHGFVPGRSHVTAAEVHLGADWVASFDIENFFPSTPKILIETQLMDLGYSPVSASLVAAFCCYEDRLVQGSPSSPVLANMSFSGVDQEIVSLAKKFGAKVTRYADDVTFSGKGEWCLGLQEGIAAALADTPWSLSQHKTAFSRLPERLKVHGLLIHGDRVRLTKGYRNRLRMFSHLKANGVQLDDRRNQIDGHLEYAKFIAGRR